MTNEEWIDSLSDLELVILFTILTLHRLGDIDIIDCVFYVRKVLSSLDDLKELSDEV